MRKGAQSGGTASRAAPLALALALGCGREELLHDLDERQAAEVLVALEDAGIRARKARPGGTDAGFTVEVEPPDAGRALRALAARELPRPRPPGFGEVFSRGGLVPTTVEERALYLHALSGELARSVESIEGVVGARVHLALPEQDPLRSGERPPPRAAVLVRCRPSACAAVRALEPGIRSLVVGAADRLEPAAVAVVVAEAGQGQAPGAVVAATPRWHLATAGLSAAAALGALASLWTWVRARAAERRAPAEAVAVQALQRELRP